jgi:hypothetical protein
MRNLVRDKAQQILTELAAPMAAALLTADGRLCGICEAPLSIRRGVDTGHDTICLVVRARRLVGIGGWQKGDMP